MEILLLGLFLWSLVHFIPSLAQPMKKAWINAMGDIGYKITFSIVVVLSLVLMVYGWRHTVPTHLYDPVVARPVAIALMVVSFLLFGAAKHPSIINSWVRHPQLTGLILWSTSHLLVNGDSRSVTLFGCLGVWAILEIIFISRREGEWIKKPIPSVPQQIKGVAISLVIFVVAALIHPYLSGVSLK
jgi:uncharacterized membrane protein